MLTGQLGHGFSLRGALTFHQQPLLIGQMPTISSVFKAKVHLPHSTYPTLLYACTVTGCVGRGMYTQNALDSMTPVYLL